MNCDKNKINRIESILQNDPKSLSSNDLIYYLKCNTNNSRLNENNIKETEQYFKEINLSYDYSNIFVNTGNYASIFPFIIGLLIPFYFSYPRFYNMGYLGFFIGMGSFITIYKKLNELYGHFFSGIGFTFFMLSIVIYFIFFIVLNQLNHISLFFISAVVSYLLLNYICRIMLTSPLESNKYNQYNASMITDPNNKYTEYNELLENACLEVIDRFKLNLPSGRMLYSFLSEFKIGKNENILTDFLTNIFSPILSITILIFLGSFLSFLKDKTILNVDNKIDLFPIIGIHKKSFKYYTCQANYILPKELNVNLLIHNLVSKYNFNDHVYKQVEKALLRISHELLTKYNPKFMIPDDTNNSIIIKNLKDNKIFIEIQRVLHKNNTDFSISNISNIENIIKKTEIPYKDKESMYELLGHIKNVLIVENEINEPYENNSILAKDELLYRKNIGDEYKKVLEKIANEYIDEFTKNLNLKDNTLFGYHYNLITYNKLPSNVKTFSNNLFKRLLSLLSTWILFAKPIGSSWLFAKYILASNVGFKGLLDSLSGKSTIMKYFSTGLDTGYFEEVYKDVSNNAVKSSYLSQVMDYIYTFIIFIVLVIIFYTYNSINFGMTSYPSWYNILYQFIFIANIIGNILTYSNGGGLLTYNMIFLGVVLLIIFAIALFMYFSG
jgi:hypothetical protein